MALGERGYFPSSQQSPFSCTNLLFSASFQEEETHRRTHAANFSSGLYKQDHQRCSHAEPSPAPSSKAIKKQRLLGSDSRWLWRKKSKLRKNSCCFCVCCSRVCAPTPVLTVLWPCHCSEARWGRVLVLMVAVSWVMRHLKQYLSVLTCSWPPQSVPSELCISVWWILWHLDCLSCIMPGDLWRFVLCNYIWEEMLLYGDKMLLCGYSSPDTEVLGLILC